MISREYGRLARQRYAAIMRPVEIDAGQSSQPFLARTSPVEIRRNSAASADFENVCWAREYPNQVLVFAVHHPRSCEISCKP